MILQSLYAYYERLKAQGVKISRKGTRRRRFPSASNSIPTARSPTSSTCANPTRKAS